MSEPMHIARPRVPGSYPMTYDMCRKTDDFFHKTILVHDGLFYASDLDFFRLDLPPADI